MVKVGILLAEDQVPINGSGEANSGNLASAEALSPVHEPEVFVPPGQNVGIKIACKDRELVQMLDDWRATENDGADCSRRYPWIIGTPENRQARQPANVEDGLGAVANLGPDLAPVVIISKDCLNKYLESLRGMVLNHGNAASFHLEEVDVYSIFIELVDDFDVLDQDYGAVGDASGLLQAALLVNIDIEAGARKVLHVAALVYDGVGVDVCIRFEGVVVIAYNDVSYDSFHTNSGIIAFNNGRDEQRQVSQSLGKHVDHIIRRDDFAGRNLQAIEHRADQGGLEKSILGDEISGGFANAGFVDGPVEQALQTKNLDGCQLLNRKVHEVHSLVSSDKVGPLKEGEAHLQQNDQEGNEDDAKHGRSAQDGVAHRLGEHHNDHNHSYRDDDYVNEGRRDLDHDVHVNQDAIVNAGGVFSQ
ncbi:hypothetical protein OIY81_3550 [Cryptosporidium canis]|uniref:Uncharacterized protein n=1 Tax=Cryptosporidium canis TaxID=195482 RepID=A0ABQ8P366_9CRYT|nr:hypothetical protein OIY81_3550 [Cryptosporidium canis]KAJ1606517.1 hypothetical protein OJ252_3145 [Cryptosporidium canis]